jgi:hypothetical protein
MLRDRTTLRNFLICLPLMALGLYVCWGFSVDDAFITFKFSKTLVDHHSLAWNLSEPVTIVEGYTNSLWMIILAGLYALGADLEISAKLMGASLAVFIYLMLAYTKYKTGSSFAAVAAALGLLLLPPTYFHAVSCLETYFYTLMMLVLSVITYETITVPDSRLHRFLPLAVLVAGLTRPEGILTGAVCLLVSFWSVPKHEKLRLVKSALLWLVLPGLIYMSVRYRYFGHLLPNTFYVKGNDVDAGLGWAGYTYNQISLVTGIIIAAGLLGAYNRRTALFLALSLVMIFAPYITSNLMMDYAARFIYHYFPVMVMFAGIFLYGLLSAKIERKGFVKGIFIFAMFMSSFLFIYNEKEYKEGSFYNYSKLFFYRNNLSACHVNLAEKLRDADIPDKYKFIAIGDAGIFPLVSDWRILDIVGLCDPVIAHRGKDVYFDTTKYVLDSKPSLIATYSKSKTNDSGRLFKIQYPFIAKRYEKIGSVKYMPHTYFGMFMNPDLPYDVKAELRSQVRKAEEYADVNVINPTGENLIKFIKKKFFIGNEPFLK